MKNCRMAKALSLLLAAVLIVSMLPSSSLTARAAGSWKWTRIAGSTRFNTMKAITQEAYKDSEKNTLNTIILATGESFPDALSGSALAGVFNCPIILTATKSLSGQAKSEIQRLAAKDCTVLILGGTGAVSANVESAVKALGVKVERVAGSTREKTAIATYKKGAAAANGFKNSDTAIVTTGYNYADALSISPYAYASKTPIFLTKKDGTLSADMKNALKSAGLKKAIIVGGTGAVAAAAETDLKNMGLTVLRLKGNNRYQTSAQISKWEMGLLKNAAFQPAVKMTNAGMGVATGENYPDALASASLLGKYGSVLMLVDASKKVNKTALQTNIDELVKPYAATMGKGYIFGGTGAVTKEVEDLLNKAVEGAEVPTEPISGTTLTFADFGNAWISDVNPFVDPLNDTIKTGLDLTQLRLLTTGRQNEIIYNAIEGETIAYHGTNYRYQGPADISLKYDSGTNQTTYTIKLRSGMKFSDGVEVTADDLIFTYYTLFDPEYHGGVGAAGTSVVGIWEYWTQISDNVYQTYRSFIDNMIADGRNNYQSGKGYSQEMYNAFWSELDRRGLEGTQEIVDYVLANYLSDDYVRGYFSENYSTADILASEGMKIAYAMAMWGFGSINDDGLFEDSSGRTYDLKKTFPTIQNFYDAIYESYEGNLEYAWSVETADYENPFLNTELWFYREYGTKDPAMNGKRVTNISGIKKLDKYSIQIVTMGFNQYDPYVLLDVYIAPMHYYGDTSKYDYAHDKFGFDYCDLSKEESITLDVLGAGSYVFEGIQDYTTKFKANSNYYLGCPKIETIQFIISNSGNPLAEVAAGKADIAAFQDSKQTYEDIGSINGTGKLTGNVITTAKIGYDGYGYIGINADTVNVNGEPGSEASKAFRKALATILNVYRDAAYEAYYGEAAELIDYPLPASVWASPDPEGAGYKNAFSVDAAGKALYTSGMTESQRYDAAVKGALSWFEKAGYTVKNGKITAAPAGGKLEIKATIPGSGTGDHPSFNLLTKAKEALESIGFKLVIEDLSNSTVLWDMLDYGTQEIWCAALGSALEPSVYFDYFASANIPDNEGGTNYYHINDTELDRMIAEAKTSMDRNTRKSIYKQCLDIVLDWAAVIPAYQRQNCYVFSTARVKTSTLTPDMTTYWSWTRDIEQVEMN